MRWLVLAACACGGSTTGPAVAPPVAKPTPAPVIAPALAPRGSIAVGEDHACAVTSANRVACWGKASDGKLGVPGGANQLTPVVVPGVVDAVGVAVGGMISCAWTSHGTVWCWGDESQSSYSHGPHQVPGLVDIVQVVAGVATACGRHRNGNVACWTADHWADPLYPPVRDLPNLDHTVELAGDGWDLCARVEGGDVACLLRTSGSRDNSMFRRRKRIIEEARGAISLSGVHERFAALVPGRLVTWVSAVLENRRFPVPEHPIETIDGIDGARVVVGGAQVNHPLHVCVLGKGARCWNAGDLVDHARDVAAKGEPIPVASPADVSVGGDLSCAREGDHVSCWGLLGRLGDNATELPVEPVDVKGVADAVQLEAYWETACVLRATGRVACWGAHFGSWDQYGKPVVDLEPVEMPGVTDAIEIAMSMENICARTRSGTKCWTSDRAGHWNVGAPSELAGATRLFTEIDLCGADAAGTVRCLSRAASKIEPALRASLATGSRCAQGPHNDALCWHGPGAIVEAMSYGQRCNVRTGGGVDCRYDDASPFVAAPALGRVVSYDGAYGLQTDGSVVGSMYGGPVSTPPAIAKLRDVVELRAGASFVCGRTRDRRVTCWGRRELLGAGTPDTSGAVRVKDLVLAAAPLPADIVAAPPVAPIAPVAKVQPLVGKPMLGPFATRGAVCAIQSCSAKRGEEVECPESDAQADLPMVSPPAPFSEITLVPINCRAPRSRDGTQTFRLVVRRADGYYASPPLFSVGGNDKYCGGDVVPQWQARDFGVTLDVLTRTSCRSSGGHSSTDIALVTAVADVPRGKPVVFPALPVAASHDSACSSDTGCTERHEVVKLAVGFAGDIVTLAGAATWLAPRQTPAMGFSGVSGLGEAPSPVGSYRYTRP